MHNESELPQPPLPRFGLGTAPLGGLYEPVDHDLAVETLLGAINLGYHYLDTAPLYGYGRAERIVRDALSSSTQPINVSTKVGRLIDPHAQRPEDDMFSGSSGAATWDFSASGVRKSLESSLERLGLDFVDVALIHDPDLFVNQAIDEAYPELEALKSEGLVGAIGVGVNDPTLATQFITSTDIDIVMIAGRYTLLDRSADIELFPPASENDVHVIAAGVYNSGILTGVESTPHFDYQPAPDSLVQKVKRLQQICSKFDVELRTAALQFPAQHPAVGTVLVGARSISEARDNIENFNSDVPPELWRALDVADVD